MNCPKNLYQLTINYFSDREAILHLNNVDISRNVTKGCPQGSCCGPAYWNIQYNSLLNIDYHKNSKVIAFADDLLLLTKGKNTVEAEAITNSDIYKIDKWSELNKIQFNQEKSKVMLISKKRAKNTNIQIYLRGQILEQVQLLKYLGIHIDNKFNFNKHIQIISDKCIKLINSLSKSAKISWGLQHSALRTIYQGAIIPIMTYGSPMWCSAIRKEKNRRKIIRVHRMMNIKIIKAFRTISYEASCILSGLIPLDLKIRAEANSYYKLSSEGLLGLKDAQNKRRQRDIKEQVLKSLEEEWETQWANSKNGAITKTFFPTVSSRLKVNLPSSPNITAILSGHGKLRSYYFRFKINDSATCDCGAEDQSVDHIVYECPIYEIERSFLISAVSDAGGVWPTTKDVILQNNFNAFIQFVKSINLELNQPQQAVHSV